MHIEDTNNWGNALHWCSGSPLLAVQHWSYGDRATLITATSKDITLLVPPAGMQYASATSDGVSRWYVPEKCAFVTAPSQLQASSSQKTLDGMAMMIAEHSLAPGFKKQTLSVRVPSGMWQIIVAYGSGSIQDGFVLVEASEAKAPNSLWLLRMKGAKATWIRYGDLSELRSLFSDTGPSFARVGALVYFAHGQSRIACIDTAATSPSITWPAKINTFVDNLYQKGATSPAGPIQPDLASEGSVLIIGYPDATWNLVYYAMDTSGTVLGSLHVSKTSVTSVNMKGRWGSSLPFKNASKSISLPSIDLFEGAVS